MTNEPMIPFRLEVVPNLARPASLHEGPDGLTWNLRDGESTHNTARCGVDEMSDEILAAVLISFGRGHVSCAEARRDPIAALGPLAHKTISWALIQATYRPHRA